MKTACPHCQHVIEHSGAPPKFCSNCGHPLSETQTDLADAETLVGAEPPPAQASPAATGATFGPYRLGRELGRGGMGVVYEAEHVETGRRLALKVLSPNIPRNSDTTERFLREGRLAAALSHPRSTFIYEAGESDGQLYISMELVPGQTLSQVVEDEGPLPVNRAVDYILDVIEGLAAAHDNGVIHRDVKPSNCFLSEANRVKVGDFGLSKSLVTDASLTRTGTFLGTPQYAAPEQVRGGSVDPRTDIYSVGATLFYLLTGRGPFTGDAAAVIAQIASDAAPSLRGIRNDIPEELNRIVARALNKEPDARFATMSELGNALRPYSTGGVSIGDVGRRLAAYFLDNMICGFVGAVIGMIVVFTLMMTRGFNVMAQMQMLQAIMSGAGVGGLIMYFAFCEGRWGCAPGKRLMGLRVVNLQGEPPGFRRALLRALVLPGVSSLPGILLPLFYVQSSMNYMEGMMPWVGSLTGWAMMLLFLASMRSRNGYRGVHEFASGTRVVGPRDVDDVHFERCPIVAPIETPESDSMIGTFRVTGKLGFCGPATILQSVDESLHRRAWIRMEPAAGGGVLRERIALTRPARPFWLTGGEVDGHRWDAFEAVVGAPVALAIRQEDASGRLPWERGRLLLLQLSEELAEAAEDNTLPATLTLDQVWVEPDGRVKLLDAPLVASGNWSAPAAGDGSDNPVADAVHVLRELTELCSGDPARAVHAQDFIEELQWRPEDASTLIWAAQRLREVSYLRSALKWDDRLGVLATSMGTEQSVYIFYAFLVAGGSALIPSTPLLLRVALVMLLATALPAVLGFWLRGGPVFQLTQVKVRHKSRPASRLRCGWRGFVAWAPNMVAWSLLGLAETVTADQAVLSAIESAEGAFYLAASVGWSFPYMLFVVCALGTLIRPARGVQDYVAGTSLVPR